MVEDALSFWTEIQRYEDLLAADAKSLCFAPLSELYRKLGLLDDAISVAQKGCVLHPDYPVGFLALGNACYAKGLTAEARMALERVVSLNPDHIHALKLLGQVYVEQNEILKAREVLTQVLGRDPDDLESSLLLNSIATVTPKPEPEEELLDDVEIIEELDEVFDELSAEDEVEPPVPAPAAQPSPGKAQVAESTAAPHQDDDDLWAIEDLEELGAEPATMPAGVAAQKQPVPDPLTTATLAELYVSQGFIEKAITIYREVLQAHPSNQQYRLRCEELLEMQELRSGVGTEPAPADEDADEEELVEELLAANELEAQEMAFDLKAPPAAEIAFEREAPVAPAAINLPIDLEGPFEDLPSEEAPIDAEALIAMDVPLEMAFSPAVAAAIPMQSPAAMESSALEVAETPAARDSAAFAPGDVEGELEQWLENIRRRKDGV